VRATPLRASGVVAGIAAALSTGAGVPLKIDGAPIPLVGFAVLTLACAAIGTRWPKALSRQTLPARTPLAANQRER
jgi:hypothetical protein